MKTAKEYYKEWESNINELSNKEIAYWKWKECYAVKEQEILETTDFKELYGANNDKIRRNHIKNELKDWYTIIKDLEISIQYLERRISFLKSLLHHNTVYGGIINADIQTQE